MSSGAWLGWGTASQEEGRLLAQPHSVPAPRSVPVCARCLRSVPVPALSPCSTLSLLCLTEPCVKKYMYHLVSVLLVYVSLNLSQNALPLYANHILFFLHTKLIPF